MWRAKRRVQRNPQFQQNGVGLLLFITNLNEYVLSLSMWDKALNKGVGWNKSPPFFFFLN